MNRRQAMKIQKRYAALLPRWLPFVATGSVRQRERAVRKLIGYRGSTLSAAHSLSWAFRAMRLGYGVEEAT